MVAMNMRKHHGVNLFRTDPAKGHIREKEAAIPAGVEQYGLGQALSNTGKAPRRLQPLVERVIVVQDSDGHLSFHRGASL